MIIDRDLLSLKMRFTLLNVIALIQTDSQTVIITYFVRLLIYSEKQQSIVILLSVFNRQVVLIFVLL